MANDDAQVAGSESARRFDEFAFTGGKNLSANEARVADPPAERERENEIEDAGTTEGDESDRQQNSGERKKRVHQDDVDETVDATTVVSGDRTDDESEGERREHNALPTSIEMRAP